MSATSKACRMARRLRERVRSDLNHWNSISVTRKLRAFRIEARVRRQRRSVTSQ